jgi:tRNA(His) 5'-end guanylyltransferase
MKDTLGDRMKSQYEDRTRFLLPRRTYTIIRLDGKAFHTYTKGLEKPFDDGLSEDMDSAIISMMPQIQGAVFAYTQSDEISILLTDFEQTTTDAWFDGNLQKMCSVSASTMTAEFNKTRMVGWMKGERYGLRDENDRLAANRVMNGKDFPLAYFDSRIFTIPDRTEVMNYFIWRNQDCARNSVSMVAQSLFSHKELQGKSTADMQEMMFSEHGINWAEYDQAKKNGRLIVKETVFVTELDYSGNHKYMVGDMPAKTPPIERSKWVTKPAWKFTEDKDKLLAMIPKYE